MAHRSSPDVHRLTIGALSSPCGTPGGNLWNLSLMENLVLSSLSKPWKEFWAGGWFSGSGLVLLVGALTVLPGGCYCHLQKGLEWIRWPLVVPYSFQLDTMQSPLPLLFTPFFCKAPALAEGMREHLKAPSSLYLLPLSLQSCHNWACTVGPQKKGDRH